MNHQLLMPKPAQQGVTVAQPINDVQMIALVAAQLPQSSPEQQVQGAIELLVEAFRHRHVLTTCLQAIVADEQRQAAVAN